MRAAWLWLRLAVAALAAAPSLAGAQEAEREAVLAVVQEFFDTMTAADSAGARAVLLPEGVSWSRREAGDGASYRSRTNADYLAGMARWTSRYVERMWDPMVLVHEGLAVVWTPYDIWEDGEFVHCGIDAFTLLETEDGWKIAGVAYTVEPTGCEPSPLGPLQEGE